MAAPPPTENQAAVAKQQQLGQQVQPQDAVTRQQQMASRLALLANQSEEADSLLLRQPQTALGLSFSVGQLAMFPELQSIAYTITSQATKIEFLEKNYALYQSSQTQYQSSQEKLQEAYNREIQQLRKDGERSERDLKHMQDKLDKEIDDNQKTKEDNKKYLLENAKLREQVEAQNSKIQSLEERLTRDEKDRSTLMELCLEQQKENKEQKEEIKDLKKEIEVNRNEISNLTKRLDEIVKQWNVSVRDPPQNTAE